MLHEQQKLQNFSLVYILSDVYKKFVSEQN
jgi:hypothetical protein